MPVIHGGGAPLNPHLDDASSIQGRFLHSLERQWLDVWRQTAGMQEETTPCISKAPLESSEPGVKREPWGDGGLGAANATRHDTEGPSDMDALPAAYHPFPAHLAPLRDPEPAEVSRSASGTWLTGIESGRPVDAIAATRAQQTNLAQAPSAVGALGREASPSFTTESAETPARSATNLGPFTSGGAGFIVQPEPPAISSHALPASAAAVSAQAQATGAPASAPLGQPWRATRVHGADESIVTAASVRLGVAAGGLSLHDNTVAPGALAASQRSVPKAVDSQALLASNMANALQSSQQEPAPASDSPRTSARASNPAPAALEHPTRRLTLRELDAQQVLAAVRDTQLNAAESQAAAQELARALMQVGYSRIQVVVNGRHERRIDTQDAGWPSADGALDTEAPPAPSNTVEPAHHGH